MIWAMASSGVPVGSVGVQALFDGEIDASTVKHRLDVLSEEPVFELPPIMCTDFKGHMHVPLWITPALFAFVFVACLLGCFNKRRELVHSAPTAVTSMGSTHGSKPLRNPKRIES